MPRNFRLSKTNVVPFTGISKPGETPVSAAKACAFWASGKAAVANPRITSDGPHCALVSLEGIASVRFLSESEKRRLERTAKRKAKQEAKAIAIKTAVTRRDSGVDLNFTGYREYPVLDVPETRPLSNKQLRAAAKKAAKKPAAC
ncbi:hypothetical protein BC831DRAFT_507359 [Entophlyctis helioformis]|nr:hypothetical protein BC831DRAFT_507359 [Entophlyctis helioformis]